MKELKKAIVQCIDDIAENEIEDQDTDDCGRLITFTWEEKIDRAIDEFCNDPREWLECQGVCDIRDSFVMPIQDYARTVNWTTIRDVIVRRIWG
jgi:hypothetical protein